MAPFLSGAPFFSLFAAFFFAGEVAVAAGTGEQVISSPSSLFVPKATFFYRDSAVFIFQSKQ